MNYAVVDIETTGGHASMHNIIEIAVIVTDGERILDSFETLVDPGQEIPRQITGLTGITSDMLEKAPSFANIADKIYEMLSDCIFVAHNVNFDYSFVKRELEMNRNELNARKLCTVRMSRKLFPGYRSYSLGNLCANLGIPLENRHRAMGDAAATCEVLHLLLKNDPNKEIEKAIRKNSKEQNLPPNLDKIQFTSLPREPGVYYFHDAFGKIIYVGKAIDIQKRVATHFNGNINSPQRQAFMRDIHSITHQLTGNELTALLLESHEIYTHWPKYNRAQKKIEFSFGIFDYTGNDGYIRLGIDRIRKGGRPVARFDSMGEALVALDQAIDEYNLCRNKCMLQNGPLAPENACDKKCSCKRGSKNYNKKVERLIGDLSRIGDSFYVTAPGRTHDEHCIISVKQGRYQGYGFIPHENCDDNWEEYIKPFPHTAFSTNVIYSFLEKDEYKLVEAEEYSHT